MIPDPIEASLEPTRHIQIAATKSLFDDLIDRHAEAYMAAYPEVEEFSAFEKSGTSNYYIGMVWTNDFERPDVNQLKIRGSQCLCKNKLVELDLSAVTSQQSFFPGQILAFQANPSLKRQLKVKRFLDSTLIAPKMKTINTDEQINLLIAAGPFMKPDTEDWLLFDRILDSIKNNNANRVVLIGPIVDLENRDISAKFDLAWKLVLDKLIESLHDHECRIYIVPSSRDILSSSMQSNYIYPCPKLKLKLNNIKENVKLNCRIESVTDPAQIDLGGLYLDVTSAEALFHMNSCLSFINKEAGSPFNSIYRHLISQGPYPIHPSSPEIPIDYPKLGQYSKLDRLGAHLLVMPTKFGSTLTNIEGRMIVTIQKCSVRKQAILIEIPLIESSAEAPIMSIFSSSYAQKSIDLMPKNETNNEIGDVKEEEMIGKTGDDADIQMALESDSLAVTTGPQEVAGESS